MKNFDFQTRFFFSEITLNESSEITFQEQNFKKIMCAQSMYVELIIQKHTKNKACTISSRALYRKTMKVKGEVS